VVCGVEVSDHEVDVLDTKALRSSKLDGQIDLSQRVGRLP
jgi:hypothetical protein